MKAQKKGQQLIDKILEFEEKSVLPFGLTPYTILNHDQEIFGSECQEVYSDRVGTDKDVIIHILYFPEYDIYLKYFGYYNSWEGSDYYSENIVEVFPKEITKTIYLTKEEYERN